ncbi:hypothetical protein CEXT_516231 [Caerostris extrusa]|uniref:Uncharacterized protein n=1 Tax=Caerostris extrusa TaxID=172846 RepID=A0AAV4NC78_CAEEX|nr:hypothetical protein CEXT_516231 [Caerostris extrusa]
MEGDNGPGPSVQWTPVGNEISGQEADLVVVVGNLNGNIGWMYRIVLQVVHTIVGRASNDAPEAALFAQPNDTDKDGRGGTMDPPLEMRFLVRRLIWLQWWAI